MKRWGILIFTGILLIGSIILLTGSVQNPSNYTGKWYYAGDGSPYLFHNGIIISEKYHLSDSSEEVFSGAYSFANNSIVLFFLTEDGVEQVQELKLTSQKDGDTLCAQMNNEMVVVFCRNRDGINKH